jgi:hypothetical protein
VFVDFFTLFVYGNTQGQSLHPPVILRLSLVLILYDDREKINDLFLRTLPLVMHDDIVVYEHPNPHMRSFFIGVSFWPPRVEVFHKTPLDTSRENVKSLGNIGVRMAKELLEIPGLRELMMRPGEILVKKDRAVTWQDIEPEVLKIVQRALRKQHIHLVKR